MSLWEGSEDKIIKAGMVMFGKRMKPAARSFPCKLKIINETQFKELHYKEIMLES